ncbi:hypothetical protein A2U01_0040788, partial [Trifolium medium]|nr:hypothetical protein [Trifolium medium]
MDFQSFRDHLIAEKNHDVDAIYMGGNLVLLQSLCEGELSTVMAGNKGRWEKCFHKVIPWKPSLVAESREIWIQIHGLPLHVWEESSFKMIAGRFGVFLDFDEATIEKQRLDVARVKLRTVRRGMIDIVLQLSVLSVLYDVWVVEERCSCLEGERCEEVEGGSSSGRVSSNSDAVGWQGDDGDLFSDGRSDSDKS